MPDDFNPIQHAFNPGFPDNEPNPMQEHEVKSRISQLNREADIMPVFTEKVNMPEGFVDELFDGDFRSSFAAWNLLRRGRKNVISITISRKDGVLVEQARLANDVRRVDGQCKELLYGSAKSAESAWMGVDRNVFSIKVDVREAYVTTARSATD